MNEPWRIQLLGGLSAYRLGQAITRFRTQKTGALLAYLAFYGGRVQAREALLELLWPGSDLDAARNSLSVALNSLRRQFEPPATPGSSPVGGLLIADRSTVRLDPAAFVTDVADFEAALRSAADAQTEDARTAALTEAVRTYAGELLPGFYDDWVLTERDRLADAHLQALRRLTTLRMQARDFDAALACAHHAVAADPLGEETRRLLMRLYAALGRPADALEQLRDLERQREEAGEDPPSAALREMALRLAEGTDKEEDAGLFVPLPPAPGVPAEAARKPARRRPRAPVPPPLPPPIGNLPLPSTRFFGRDPELARLGDLLDPEADGDAAVRLVTLTGPGGAGKTRLALETAARLQDGYPGGAWFVPLADLVGPGRVPDAVRDALRLPRVPAAEPLEQVAAALSAAAGPSLLVLDNAEHLLAGGPLDAGGLARLAADLLRRAPGATLLVTSRRALGIPEEREFPVPPLPAPADPSLTPARLLELASVQLFVDRCRARRVDFAVTPRNAESIARLCAHLEGIPLALELAAAWSKLFTPAQMWEQMADSLDLLVSRNAGVPERHRTLRSAIAWSLQLLSPDVRRFWTRLAVFRGGWTVEAAEAVCAAGDPALAGRAVECLTLLRDAALVVAEECGAGTIRLRLLEPLREFADETLDAGEREDLGRRHAEHFSGLAEDAFVHAKGPEQALWFDRLEADHDNLRAALNRAAAAGDDDALLRLTGALAPFWKVRGHLGEGTAGLERAIGAADAAAAAAAAADAVPNAVLARAAIGAGALAYDRGDFAAAEALYRRCLALHEAAGDEEGAAKALNNLGNVAYRRERMPEARALYGEALARSRALGFGWGIASALGSLGNVAQAEGDIAAARALQEESLARSREIGETRMTAYTLHNLGNLAASQGDWEAARRWYAESLPAKRALGDRRGVAALLISLGLLSLETGDTAGAGEPLREALLLGREIGALRELLAALEGMAWWAGRTGSPERAALLWAAAKRERDWIGASHTPREADRYSQEIAAACTAAGPAAFDAAWADGERLTLLQAADAALENAIAPVESP